MSVIGRLFYVLVVAVGMVTALPAPVLAQKAPGTVLLNGEFTIAIPNDDRMESTYLAAADAVHAAMLPHQEAGSFGPTSETGKSLFLFVLCVHSQELEELKVVYKVDGFEGIIAKRKQDAVANGHQVQSPSHKQLAELALSELVVRWKEHQLRAKMVAKAMEGAPQPHATIRP